VYILPVNLAWEWRQSVFYHKMGSFCIYKQQKRISILCYGEFMESAILHNIRCLSFLLFINAEGSHLMILRHSDVTVKQGWARVYFRKILCKRKLAERSVYFNIDFPLWNVAKPNQLGLDKRVFISNSWHRWKTSKGGRPDREAYLKLLEFYAAGQAPFNRHVPYLLTPLLEFLGI